MTRGNRAWNRAWAWCCGVLVLVACGTPDNGGVDISFGPSSVSSTAPVTSIGSEESSSDGGESSSTTDDPVDPTNDPLTTTDATDWEEGTESSGGSDDESSSSGGAEEGVQCSGLDEATCTVTLGCGWPNGDGIFGMGGPCGWDPAACPSFDQLSCLTSPACTLMLDELNQQVCTGVGCEVLDQIACPTIVGCFWFADPDGGGVCFGNGFP